MEPFSKIYDTDWIEVKEVGGGCFGTEDRHTVYTMHVIPVKFSFLKELPNGYLIFEMGKPNANLGNSFDERFSASCVARTRPIKSETRLLTDWQTEILEIMEANGVSDENIGKVLDLL